MFTLENQELPKSLMKNVKCFSKTIDFWPEFSYFSCILINISIKSVVYARECSKGFTFT